MDVVQSVKVECQYDRMIIWLGMTAAIDEDQHDIPAGKQRSSRSATEELTKSMTSASSLTASANW